jgi:hypothetical protein
MYERWLLFGVVVAHRLSLVNLTYDVLTFVQMPSWMLDRYTQLQGSVLIKMSEIKNARFRLQRLIDEVCLLLKGWSCGDH